MSKQWPFMSPLGEGAPHWSHSLRLCSPFHELPKGDGLPTMGEEAETYLLSLSKCPWCGRTGPDYRDAERPSAYCHHE